jgi:hypothetical protein
MKEILNFNIINTTNGIVPVSLFGNNGDPMDNANASTQYSWNLGGYVLSGENTITIQNKGINSASFSLSTVSFSGTSLNDVVTALNTLNLGSFFVTTSGSSNIINNYNNNVVFGILNIFNNSAPSLTYAFQGAGTGGSATIVNNTTATTLFTGSTPNALGVTGNLSSFVSNGNSITFSGNGDNLGILVSVVQTNNSTLVQTILYSAVLGSLAPFTNTFTISTGFSYRCIYTSP